MSSQITVTRVTFVFLSTLISATLPITDKNKFPFIAWEHYLQECGAEMPHQCSGCKSELVFKL